MFSDESNKTWCAVGMIGCSAFLFICYVAFPKAPLHTWINISAMLLAVVGLALSMTKDPLNRNLGAVYSNLRSGKQIRSSPLQKLCITLGIVIIVIISGRTLFLGMA
jgi:hypothetical protein